MQREPGMIDDVMFEWRMHRLLRRIARQRVTMVLQPGSVKVIGRAIPNDENTLALVYTAEIRGWVELLHPDIPTGRIGEGGDYSSVPSFSSREHYWRLTDSGWAAIQRRHQLSLLGILVAAIGVYVAAGA
jgi:hypothetical protein